MADKKAVATGPWSSTSTWDGGTLPSSTDDVYANGFTVTIDQDITANTLRTTSGTGITAGGGFVIASGSPVVTIPGGLNATLYNGVNTSYILTISGGTPTINANATAGNQTARHAVNITGGTVTWVGSATGGSAVASVYGIVVNAATLNLTGAVAGGSTGAAILVNHASAVVNVTGNVTTGNGSSGYGIHVFAAGTLVVNGNVTGGSSNGAYGINIAAAAAVTINGNVTGGTSGSTPHGINLTSTPTLTVNGNVAGNAGTGINAVASNGALITVTGDVTAGSSAYGMFVGSGSSATVRGSLRGAGSSSTYQAINSDGILRFSGHIYSGNLTPSTGASGFFPLAGRWSLIAGEETSIHMFQDDNYPSGIAGTEKVLTVYGTSNPDESDVREGTTYGTGGTLTGTLAVPAPESVLYGVPVDDTVGLASIGRQEIAEIVGAKLAGVSNTGA